MATATLRQMSQEQRAMSDQSPQHLRDGTNSRSSSHTHSSRQEDKSLVIRNHGIAVGGEIVPAEHIPEDPARKQLGFSSQKLRVEDFELMKTLGTGMLVLYALRHLSLQLYWVTHHSLLTGTFARVWLARMANSRQEDRNKVFALKVLRKVDGRSRRPQITARETLSKFVSHQVKAS